MSEQKSTVEKIRELPIVSGAIAAAGALSLTETFNFGVLLFSTPIASLITAASGALDMFDKKRSRLSRAFSAAAAGIGIAGVALPALAMGPEAALGAIIISGVTMTVAGAFNVASYLTRNKKIPYSVTVKKDEPKKNAGPSA